MNSRKRTERPRLNKLTHDNKFIRLIEEDLEEELEFNYCLLYSTAAHCTQR